MSFLRKQESRLLCVCYGVPAMQSGTQRYFLDCHFHGNDFLDLARQENGRLLHSANMLPFPIAPNLPNSCSFSLFPTRVGCSPGALVCNCRAKPAFPEGELLPWNICLSQTRFTSVRFSMFPPPGLESGFSYFLQVSSPQRQSPFRPSFPRSQLNGSNPPSHAKLPLSGKRPFCFVKCPWGFVGRPANFADLDALNLPVPLSASAHEAFR